MPQSDIVFGVVDDDEIEDDLLHEMKLKAFRLYEKYIKNDSELEVNISYQCRKKLMRLMGNDKNFNKWLAHNENQKGQFKKLLDLFDECCEEVFPIDSFNRF